jgi:HK97 family phage portal protein
VGAFDALKRLAGTGSVEIPVVPQFINGWTLQDEVMGMSSAEVWRTQPHLRTVVTFLARNIAQCGLHTFQRVDENDRKRVRDGALAKTLSRPNDQSTSYELIFGLVADVALYDVAYLFYVRDTTAPGGWSLYRLNPDWVTPLGGDAFAYDYYRVRVNGGTDTVDLPASKVLAFHGWNPGDARQGSSPVVALKSILAEQMMAVKYRQQVWERGGRVSAVITRPAGVDWSDKARRAFRADWNSKYTGDGAGAGGTPILEDGMSINKLDFNAHEQQFVEAAKLALSTVASAYHVNPTMVGVLENANYSNVREFRKMLYGDTLGPIIASMEDRLNTFLVPLLDPRPGIYVEFNIAEKLQGNFEEQTNAIQSSVGRPWMTADEARSRFNLPALGGDAESLVTPLNVLIGGQSSVADGVTAGGGGGSVDDLPAASTAEGLDADTIVKLVNAASALIRSGFDPEGALTAVGLDPVKHLGLLPVTVQKPVDPPDVDQSLVDDIAKSGVAPARDLGATKGLDLLLVQKGDDARARFKAEDLVPDTYPVKAADVFRKFFERQAASVLASINTKNPDWWDADRWDKELTDDLYRLAATTSHEMGKRQAAALGFSEGDYDLDRTLKFLKAVAGSRAGMVNGATLSKLKAAVDDPEADPGDVFEEAKNVRSGTAGKALMSAVAGFALTETASQLAPGSASKTWVVNSANPRSDHAAMNGETVPVSDTFSNGADWPGDPVLGAEGVANCNCTVDVSID